MRSLIIPARGGSKRIPKKNTCNFLGKPIIQYSIECALNSNIFDEIIISTDDDKTAELASALGIPTNPNRPSSLSDDTTPIIEVLRYEIENKSFSTHSSVTLLFACAPLVKPKDLVNAVSMFENQSKYSSLMTVAEYPAPIEWAISIEKNEVIFDRPDLLAVSSADLRHKFYDAAQFYIYQPEKLMSSSTGLITTGILPYIIPRNIAVDIDTYEDWELAEKLYKAQFSL